MDWLQANWLTIVLYLWLVVSGAAFLIGFMRWANGLLLMPNNSSWGECSRGLRYVIPTAAIFGLCAYFLER